MMKKRYETPNFQKIVFESHDLITLSMFDFEQDGIEDNGEV